MTRERIPKIVRDISFRLDPSFTGRISQEVFEERTCRNLSQELSHDPHGLTAISHFCSLAVFQSFAGDSVEAIQTLLADIKLRDEVEVRMFPRKFRVKQQSRFVYTSEEAVSKADAEMQRPTLSVKRYVKLLFRLMDADNVRFPAISSSSHRCLTRCRAF